MYKLMNGQPVAFTGKYIRHNGRIYANPTAEQLQAAGYKPLIRAEPPEEKDGFYINVSYSETEDEIIQAYEYVKIDLEGDIDGNTNYEGRA